HSRPLIRSCSSAVGCKLRRLKHRSDGVADALSPVLQIAKSGIDSFRRSPRHSPELVLNGYPAAVAQAWIKKIHSPRSHEGAGAECLCTPHDMLLCVRRDPAGAK